MKNGSGDSAYVIGVGMTKFEKPGRRENWDYPQMAKEAGTKALEDAGVGLRRDRAGVRRLRVRRVVQRPPRGVRARADRHPDLQRQQQLLDRVDRALPGRAGDPVRARATSPWRWASRRCSRARWAPRSTTASSRWATTCSCSPRSPRSGFPPAPWMFGAAGREHMEQYGTTPEHFAKIGFKNHQHSVNNPYAQFQQEYTLDEILGSPEIYSPLTKLQCSPTSDGSGAAVLASEAFVDGTASPARRSRSSARRSSPTSRRLRDPDRARHHRLRHERRPPRARRTSRPGSARRTSRSSSCTTASPPTSCWLYEALGLCGEGEAGEAHRQRRHDVRRPLGGQPVRRPDLQGPPARRHRPRAVRRAHLAAARHRRRPPGRRRRGRAPAQHRPRRLRRGLRLPARGLMTSTETLQFDEEGLAEVDRPAAGSRSPASGWPSTRRRRTTRSPRIWPVRSPTRCSRSCRCSSRCSSRHSTWSRRP